MKEQIRNPWQKDIGIATHDVDPNDKLGSLQVMCVENSPFFAEDIKVRDEDVTFGVDDEWGSREHSTCQTTNAVPTIYLGSRSNQSIPNVVQGEQVIVYRYGNSDKAYWTTFRRDEKLRKREIVKLWAVSDPSKMKELSDDNTYFFEMNSLQGKKKIHLATSKKDGESFKYDILIDIEGGQLSITDDNSNIIRMESEAGRIFMKNKKGSSVDADGENVFITATDSIYLRAKNRIFTQSKMLMIDHVTGILKVISAAIKNCSSSKSC